MTLDEAKAILRGKQSAQLWQLGAAADVVLAYAEGMESRARKLHAAADPGGRRDAVLENIRSGCSYILGETTPIGLAHRLAERNDPILDNYGPAHQTPEQT